MTNLVKLARSFGADEWLFEREGVYFRLTRADIEWLEAATRPAGEPRADGIAAELRQLADTNEADGAGDMIGFTPNALRAIADRIDGAPVKSKGDPT